MAPSSPPSSYPYPFAATDEATPAGADLAKAVRLAAPEKGYFLPLAAFKWCPDAIINPKTDTNPKVFLSSGTTGALRSRSAFSAEGLAAYKAAAIAHFSEVLAKLTSAANSDIRLISLIPPHTPSSQTELDNWGDSSLAFMVEAFSGRWQLQYVTPDQLQAAYEQDKNQPVVLLGTALHWLAVLEHAAKHGQSVRFGQNTWLLETGGTKGQYRQLDRSTFYAQLTKGFGITDAQIISEYGSCELAAQAYDVSCSSDQHRRFRFAKDVKVYVGTPTEDGMRLAATGTGTLLIDDPNRSDFPYLFATEDRIELSVDGSFKLLGRLHHAPLKGCSLLAETLPLDKQLHHLSKQPSASRRKNLNAAPLPPQTIGERITALHELWQTLLSSPEFGEAIHQDMAVLSREPSREPSRDDNTGRQVMSPLGVKSVAEGVISDLKTSLLVPNQDYLAAIGQIIGRSCLAADPAAGREGEPWLIVLPSAHPVAGLYPITMAAILGLSLLVRASSRRRFRSLSLFFNRLQNISFVRMKLVAGDDDLARSLAAVRHSALPSGLMVFGEDATLALFQNALSEGQVPGEPAPMFRGFGHALAGTIVGRFAAGEVSGVIKDIVSLAGRGCLSSRFVGVVSERPEDYWDWAAALGLALGPYQSHQDGLGAEISASEELIYLLLGYKRPEGGFRRWQLLEHRELPAEGKALRLALPPSYAPLPLVWLGSDPGAALQGLASLRKLSVASTVPLWEGIEQVEICPLGQLNVNPVTGLHLGQPLY